MIQKDKIALGICSMICICVLSDPFHLYDQHWWSKLVEIIEDLWLVSLWLGTMGSLGESTSGRWRSSQAGGSSLVRLALVPSLTLHPGMPRPFFFLLKPFHPLLSLFCVQFLTQ